MKKVLISLLVGVGLFGFSMSVDAAPANPSFKDDNFYNCVVESWKNQNRPATRGASYEEDFSDVNLTDDELAEIEELDCSNRNIKDVSGLEKLTGLFYLNLEDNHISHINLSNNLYLEELYLEGNECHCVDVSKNRFVVINMLYRFAPPQGNPQALQMWDPELAYEEAEKTIQHLRIEYGEDLDNALVQYEKDNGIKVITDSDGNACEVKDEENIPNNQNTNKAQIVKVPSTGLNAGIIFTVVGVAIILVAGIVIWVFVKDKKSKK